MLGLDLRAARYTWTVVFILLLLRVVYLIRETLFLFVVALLFAYLLWPLVNLLNERLPGQSRVPALVIVYLLLVGVLIVIGIAVGSRVVVEANALAKKVPELISGFDRLSLPTAKGPAVALLQKQFADHSRDLLSLLPHAALNVLSHAGSLVFLVLVPILSFFFLKDGRAILRDVLGIFAEGARREIVQEIADDLHLLLALYMRALVLLAVTAFAAYGLFLTLIGVPYAVLLATVAFPLEFIPIVGPLTAAVIILTVAGLSGFHHLLWIIAFIILFRGFQDYILSPNLLSAGVKLHPLVVIFGVLAGGEIAGTAGIVLSVPILATLRIVYRQSQKRPLDISHHNPEAEIPDEE